MWMSFWQGFAFGLTLQLSVGPVCLAVLRQSATAGLGAAFRMIWGVAVVDALYLLASLLGVAALLQIDVIRRTVLVAGAGLLLYVGAKHLWTAGRLVPREQDEGTGGFWYGVGMTLTNPLTILFWSGVFGSLIASGTLAAPGELLLFSVGCVLSTVVFLGLVSAGGASVKRLLLPSLLKWLDRIVGIVLFCFGLSMLFH
jgi:threonine/homoserine/homoserine lactone efflux protein